MGPQPQKGAYMWLGGGFEGSRPRKRAQMWLGGGFEGSRPQISRQTRPEHINSVYLYELRDFNMKGLEIRRNGGEPIRIGAEDGLLLVMFNHINRFGITDFHACVTEYATGDRYRYASEIISEGDVYEIRYTEFDNASAPIKLDKKGERPLQRRESQEFETPEYPEMEIDHKGESVLKGWELSLNGKTARGALAGGGSGIIIDSKNDFLQISFSGTPAEGVMCKWFSSELMPGDVLKIRSDEFPVETLATPVKIF